MSTPSAPAIAVVPVQPRSNRMAIAGFACAALGLLLCCCFPPAIVLCPIGLVLSFIGLFRRPRGFAVFGVILGLIGSTCGLALVLAVLAVSSVAAFIGGPDTIKDMAMIGYAVERYEDAHGTYPRTIGDLHLSEDTTTDAWGHPYVYEYDTERGRIRIFCVGRDGQVGTIDDFPMIEIDTD